MKRLMLLALIILLAGCSTAGPFVTSISSDGRGNLVVEKDSVEFNGWLGVVGNKGQPTTSTINLGVKEVN